MGVLVYSVPPVPSPPQLFPAVSTFTLIVSLYAWLTVIGVEYGVLPPGPETVTLGEQVI